MKKSIIIWIILLGILTGIATATTYIPQCYLHQVTNTSDNGYWAQAMKYLNDSGYTTITVQQYGQMKDGIIPKVEKPIIINFDDGRKEILTNAYPIMAKYGFVGVVAYPVEAYWFNPKLTWEDLKFLQSKGWEIASHGYEGQNILTYPKDKTNYTFLLRELNGSKQEIYKQTGIMPEYYVFPENGANQKLMDLCRSIYKYCGSNASMSDWNDLTWTQREDYGLGRLYCEGSKNNANIDNDMLMLKLRLTRIFQGDFMTHTAVNMTQPTTKPIIPNEINMTINNSKYKCTLIQ